MIRPILPVLMLSGALAAWAGVAQAQQMTQPSASMGQSQAQQNMGQQSPHARQSGSGQAQGQQMSQPSQSQFQSQLGQNQSQQPANRPAAK